VNDRFEFLGEALKEAKGKDQTVKENRESTSYNEPSSLEVVFFFCTCLIRHVIDRPAGLITHHVLAMTIAWTQIITIEIISLSGFSILTTLY
jgi:hypothetical protein